MIKLTEQFDGRKALVALTYNELALLKSTILTEPDTSTGGAEIGERRIRIWTKVVDAMTRIETSHRLFYGRRKRA